jgi:hypothetical protein
VGTVIRYRWFILKTEDFKMHILRIEHEIYDFESWKKAFDSDPVGRQKAGVRRYRIFRPVDDSKHVMVDLEFDSARQAENLSVALRGLWGKVEGKIMANASSQIIELVETREF